MTINNIEIPDFMADLPKDSRGIPIPFVVLIDSSGKPCYTANDTMKLIIAADNKLCNVCGKSLGSDIWFIGGQQSAFHPRGAFGDSPMHKECGIFSLKVCPYLANARYNSAGITTKTKEAALAAGAVALMDSTAGNARLKFMVFLRCESYTVKRDHLHLLLFYPQKPYLEIEYWYNTERVSKQFAADLLKQGKEHNYLPKK